MCQVSFESQWQKGFSVFVVHPYMWESALAQPWAKVTKFQVSSGQQLFLH
jgi:hypothetical protein